MTEFPPPPLDDEAEAIIAHYRRMISIALDGMSMDEIRDLVEAIEDKLPASPDETP